jgi:Phage tail lysozyme
MPFDFSTTVRRLYSDLARDIPEWGREDRLACIGNAAHECGGFKLLQEKNPVVAGAAGGWGFFQWTGPRRRAFFAWAKTRGFAPDSYEANYGFLLFELRTSEPKAIGATRKAKGLEAKVKAFELAFERAGVKHYPSRIAWAKRAAGVLGPEAAEPKLAPDVQAVIPPPPKPLTKSRTIWSTITGFFGVGGAGLLSHVEGVFSADWKTVLAVGLVIGLLAGGLVIYERVKKG